MPCFHPITGYRALRPNENGKYPLLFTRPKDGMYELQQISCGQCIGCRLERSRIWAVRCEHEARLYGDQNMFLTLTFNPDQKVELTNNLVPKVFVDFMKRLRKRCGTMRFFHCGEYGSLRGRPHHHAIIFGYRFPDLQLLSRSGSGSVIYRSALLEELWPFGFSSVGDVTFESCAYVARYILKKQTGPDADYKGKHPEYITMSRRPGIGKDFYEKFERDIYSHDRVVVRDGIFCRPPRYYDNLFAVSHGVSALEQLKEKRKEVSNAQVFGQYKRDNQNRCLAIKASLDKLKSGPGLHRRRYEEMNAFNVHNLSALEQKEIITKETLKKLPRSLEDEKGDLL